MTCNPSLSRQLSRASDNLLSTVALEDESKGKQSSVLYSHSPTKVSINFSLLPSCDCPLIDITT